MIHICISFNHNYLNQFCSLLESIICNSISKISFHLIYHNGEDYIKSKIEKRIYKSNNIVNFYEIDDSILDNIRVDSWGKSTYYKLFFPEIVNDNIDRILYIDTDTTVLKDLSSLFNIDLQGNSLAAVFDKYVIKQELIEVYEGEYFNAGVLLIDVQKWKSIKAFQKCIEIVKTNPEKILFVDQCCLNYVFRNKWYKLDFHNNLTLNYIDLFDSQKNLNKLINNTTIVHYTLKRPWVAYNMHPFEKKYVEYGQKSEINNFKHILVKEYLSNKDIIVLYVKNWYNRYPNFLKIWVKIFKK